VAAIVAVCGTLEVFSAREETQTWDEGIHISAGYAYLTAGDFRWNQEHPPLAKLMSALPLWFLKPTLPVGSEGWRKQDETQVGIDLLYQNRVSAETLLLAARSMTMLLSLLFLAGLAWIVRRRFGEPAALLALCLCAFDPNLIAHARYVTTDFPVTVFYVFSVLLWMEYLLDGGLRNIVLAAAAFALALVTKFSAILLIPTLAVLYAIRWWQEPRQFPIRRLAGVAAMFAGATLVTVTLLYWPETVRSLNVTAPRLAQTVNRGNLVGEVLYRTGRWFDLPDHAFLAGLGKVAEHNHGGHASYLLGMRSDQGWWYYFPAVFAVKSTIAALAATSVLLAGGAIALRRFEWRSLRAASFVWYALLVPPLIYFAFSMTSAINIGVRHILPVYPFLYVAAALVLAQSALRPAIYATLALAALQTAECARITPDYLAFFNALAGGPGNGPRYLVDSNIDWGQDLKKLKKWLDAHGIGTIRIMYFGNAQMPEFGIKADFFPDPLDEKGWSSLDGYAVASVTPLNGVYLPLDRLAPLRFRQPVAKVGWSLYVYDFRKTK
jgi:hypothetical protein